MEITIDTQLKAAAQRLAIGVILAPVEVTKHEPSLWSEIDIRIGAILASIRLEAVCDLPQIKAIRDAYRSLGKDPSRYRASQEALFRRILQGKGLFRINTVVDINNLVSLESVHSVGSYDFSQLNFPITFRIGQKGEVYKAIGKESINLEGLPILADANGPFGSPTSDSERAMITTSTREVMMLIIAFSGSDGLHTHNHRAAQLLSRFAKAQSDAVRQFVVD
jgi:DNA/RNA-binding domain of Phe-tRNA-synthetase-like protein